MTAVIKSMKDLNKIIESRATLALKMAKRNRRMCPRIYR